MDKNVKIFICKKCQKYCYVLAGLISDCCRAAIYIPPKQEERKVRVNPAV